MAQSENLSEKLQELIALAEAEGDKNAQIVLLTLQGARGSGDDGLLARRLQDFIKDVLLPNTMAKVNAQHASKN